MKKQILTKLFSGIALLNIAVSTVSCSKENDVQPGNSQVKVINAAQGANRQDFYLANNMIASSIAYGSSSDYVTANAGNNLTAEFRNAGTENVYKAENLDLDRDRYYSIILAGSGEQARVLVSTDELSNPTEGQAKIRFIHVSDVLRERTIYVANENNETVASDLAYNSVSDFFEIDPSVTVLKVAEVGSTEFKNISLEAFMPNKIYSIVLSGSGDIESNQILHN